MRNKSISKYLLLYVAVMVYSCNSIFGKLASGYSLLSWEFVLFYGLSIVVLGAYAILWQQVLKRFDLSVAYAAKPIATILTMVWGVVLFREQVSWNMILGMAVILGGIWVVMTEDGK